MYHIVCSLHKIQYSNISAVIEYTHTYIHTYIHIYIYTYYIHRVTYINISRPFINILCTQCLSHDPTLRSRICRQVANLNRCCRFCRPRPRGPAMPGPAPVFRRRRFLGGPGPGVILPFYGEFMGKVMIAKQDQDAIGFWMILLVEFGEKSAGAQKKRLLGTIYAVKF